MDGSMEDEYSFVAVSVKGRSDVSILFHKPYDGNSAVGGDIHRLFFHTMDCHRGAEYIQQLGVKMILELQEVPWGARALFGDLCRNAHALLEGLVALQQRVGGS